MHDDIEKAREDAKSLAKTCLIAWVYRCHTGKYFASSTHPSMYSQRCLERYELNHLGESVRSS